MRVLPVLIMLFLLYAAPVLAAGKEAVAPSASTYGNWRVYKITERGQPVCYMTLTAHFPKNAKIRRSDAYLTITHRPGESSKDVISYTAGYNFKPASSAELRIGKQSFSLFTSQDTAWSRDAATDHKIAGLIRTASDLTITGEPTKKTVASLTDKFALKGADAAYHAIGKACGVEVVDKPAPKPAVKAKPKAKKQKR